MRRLLAKLPLAFALAAPLAFAQYSYFLVDTTMAGPPSLNWTTSNTSDMLVQESGSGAGNGGEVRGVYVAGGYGDGSFQIFLAAYPCYNICTLGGQSNFTSGYQLTVSPTEVNLTSVWVNYNTYPASYYYYNPAHATIPTLQTGSVIRAVWRNDSSGGVDVIVYVNNALVLFYHDTSTGIAPGNWIGFNFPYGSAASFVSEGDAGVLYTGAPNAIPSGSIGVSALTNQVDLQWPAATEPGGVGIYGYQILRNGQLIETTTGLSYSDLTTSPSSTYTYTIRATDFHWNTTDTNITVNTPLIPTHGPYPSSTPDGFRTGVKPTGTYWGSGNENIDVMSGNVSFSLPLLKAQARTSWSVPFNLSYNSQDWRQDSGGAWALAGDVGVGFGWRLMAGSITPVVSGSTASLYIFTDSTGAEYRLDQNNNNIWSSLESIYVYFDANLDILHFRDGSFWSMGCVSSASEADSGVMYPTILEDTSGNEILINYNAGAGANWTNSSSRINTIKDVRGSTGSSTFTFAYNSDAPTPHLMAITNSIATGEQYTFSYLENQSISSPISGTPFGETTFLSSTTVTGLNVVTTFGYDGSGEMTEAVLPYGGYLKWSYDTVAYSGGHSYREVQNRYLSKDGTTGSQTTYAFSHESPVSTAIHQYTTISDPSGVSQKTWTLGQSGVGMGLVTEYQGIQLPGTVVKTQNNFTWSQDSVGNSYISSTLNTLDPGQSYQAQSQTTQTVDTYGNVLQVNNYNYGNLSTPARTSNYTYLKTNAYTSLYILNRLTLATVTIGSTTYPLGGNTYDSSTISGCYFSTVTNPSSNWDSNYASATTRGVVTQSSTPSSTTNYCYNQLGVVTSVTSNGVTTSVTTSNGNSYAAPTQLSVGSLTSSLSWSSFLGLTNDTGPNGDSSSTYYDSYARQTSVTSPFGATTGYAYNSAPYTSSNPATVTTQVVQAVLPGAPNRFAENTLDGLGRTVLTTTGDQNGTKSQAETVYGSCGCSPTGKMIQQSLPHAPGASPIWTIYTYDGIGRTVSVLAPDGASTTTYLYQGNAVKVTDPAGKWKIFTMDVFGNLTQVDEPNPGSGTAPPPVFPPTFSAPPGTYGSTQSVTLSSATSGATIYYTTNGSTPNQSSTQYTGPITVSSTTTISAIAYESGMANSAISSGAYTISTGGTGGSWTNGYTYRTAAVIASGQITGTLTNYPALISLSSLNLKPAGNGGAVQHTVTQSGGNPITIPADFLVTSDATGNSQLTGVEFESYSATAGTALVWVNVPSAAVGSPIYIWYGNSSVSAQQGTVASVWNSSSGSYGIVYHMADNAATKTVVDSTSSANAGTAVNNTSAMSSSSGKIGPALSFNGSTDAIKFPNVSGSGGPATISFWMNQSATSGTIVGAYNGGTFNILPINSSIPSGDGAGSGYAYWGSGLPSSGWVQVVFTYAGTNRLCYVNGAQQSVSLGSANWSGTAYLTGGHNYLGSDWTGEEGYGTMSLEEFRYSTVAASSAWIAADYNNQSAPGTFWTLTYDQTSGGSGGSYPTPVGMPTFSPAPGTYNSSLNVTLSSSTTSVYIRYTTDGTTPSETAGAVYNGAIPISGPTTIKAIAYESGMADSEISTVTYTISSSGGGADYLTYYTYDGWNNLTQVSMPRPTGTQTRTFSYSGSLLVSATNPENGTVNYSYSNPYLKVSMKTDAKGQAVVYSYDGFARLTMVQRYPAGTSNAEDTCQRETYYYDGANPVNSGYAQYAAGRLSAIQYQAPASGYAGTGCGTTFTEQYSYSPGGAKTNKGVLIARSPATADLESSYTYDNEGRMLTEQYPGSSNGSAGPSIVYQYDPSGRLNTMTDQTAGASIVTATTYDPANRLLTMAGLSHETRAYNAMGQLITLSNNAGSMSYSYSATQNNGKIATATDISGEQVVYAYDALNRLASAAATSGAWGQSYSFDGFGNLTDQIVTAGTAPPLTTTYTTSNTQGPGDCADANGNLNSNVAGPFYCNGGYVYDVSNRIVSLPSLNTQYAYAPGNKRVWRGTSGGNGSGLTLDEITFWSVNGTKLATYNLAWNPGTTSLTVTLAIANYNFGRKLVGKLTPGFSAAYIGADRLGSIGKYYPWGQEKPSATTNGTEKFTGYFRDAETTNDYAINRYHQPGMGRFLTPDPYMAKSGGAQDPNNPGSWNQYAYVQGDPVNNTDRRGLLLDAQQCIADPDACVAEDSQGDAGGCVSDGTGGVGALSFASVPVYCNDNDQKPGAYVLAPPPGLCPLVGIFGDFTTHQGGSSTPVHTIFNPTVAGILDVVIAQLNLEGIDPVIEDGFRTISEQADRRKRYPTTAASGLSWHEIGDAIDFQRNSNLAAINAVMIAAGFTAVNGDPGHYQMKIGALTNNTVAACTLAHPNGN